MRNRIFLLIAAALLAAAVPSVAAVDAFLKIDGINGESKQAGHQGWIELQSATLGLPHASNNLDTFGHTNGASRGNVQLRDLTIMKSVDTSSPQLFKAAVTGEHFKNAVLDLHGEHVVMHDVTVSSVQKIPGGPGPAREDIRLSFVTDQIESPSIPTAAHRPPPTDVFLQLQGIDGGSKDPGHRGWIQLQSADVSALTSPRDAATGQASGKRQFKPVRVVAEWGAASPQLSQAALNGRRFQTGILDVHGVRYVLQDVSIESVQKSGDEYPTESLSLNFTHVEYNNSPSTAPGNTPPPNHQHLANGALMFTGGVRSAVNVHDVTLLGNRAIIVVCDQPGHQSLVGLLMPAQTKQRLAALTLAAQGGPQLPAVQFNFSNVVIEGITPAAGGCSQVSLQFSRVDGPASGFHMTTLP